ncbi:hypothetical protein EAE99_009297 [Botrytis elliptica]|nr:hypothetical protein EAE99_009297 [Botrytis elliptica]
MAKGKGNEVLTRTIVRKGLGGRRICSWWIGVLGALSSSTVSDLVSYKADFERVNFHEFLKSPPKEPAKHQRVQRSAYSAGYQHQQQASAGQITNDGLNNQAPWAQSTIPSRGFSRNVESAPDSTDTSSSVNRLISVLNRLRRA